MLNDFNKLLEKKYFPLIPRIITLAAFIALVIIGFSAWKSELAFQRLLSITNLTTSFIWRLWWPVIILSAIFLGRVWCMICPVEMITAFFSKIGLKRKRPGWVLSGWVITLLYAVIVVAGITIIEIDRVPKYTSAYLLSIMGLSVVTGVIFEKNTFCRYVCPVGYLLGLFSKFSVLGWRVKNNDVCKSCTDKSCIKTDYRYNLNYKSCGIDLVPASIDSNSDCILCTGCVKTCKSYQSGINVSERPNPALVKTGFASDLLKVKPLLIAEWVFLFFISAHLIDEIIEYRLVIDLSSLIFPASFHNFSGMDPGMIKNAAASGYLFFILPVILWFTPYLLIYLSRIRITLKEYIKNFSLIFLPVLVGFFVGLIIMEIHSKLPYYQYILKDVTGVNTIRQIITKQIVIPPFAGWVEWILLGILLAATFLSIFISLRIIKKLMMKFSIPINKRVLMNSLPFVFVFILFTEALLFTLF